jgi:hypothetical protein
MDQVSEQPRFQYTLKKAHTSISTSVDAFPLLPDISQEMHRLEEDII